MPILVRIVAQRAIMGVGAVLGFFGLAPEPPIPDPTHIAVEVDQNQQNIAATVAANTPEITPYQIINTIDAATSRINNEIQKAPVKTIDSNQVPIQTQTQIFQQIVEPAIIEPIDVQQIQENIQQEIKKVVLEVVPTEKIEPLPVKKNISSSRSIENVLVNIICTHTNGNATTASTGSGVIVSSNGIVLTNAHVAQYFLLKNWSRPDYMNCLVYQKNNPTLGYQADILYIQPEWVRKNAYTVSSKNPRGTGEDDYAFLIITGSNNFNYAQISRDESLYEIGQPIQVGGFPGAPSSILELSQAGNLATDNTEISNVFTLEKKSIDAISTESTPVAQRGASGGGVFNNNNLIGIIFSTSGSGKNAKINAITTTYIDRDLIDDTGSGIRGMLSGDARNKASQFIEETVPNLAKLLSEYL